MGEDVAVRGEQVVAEELPDLVGPRVGLQAAQVTLPDHPHTCLDQRSGHAEGLRVVEHR